VNNNESNSNERESRSKQTESMKNTIRIFIGVKLMSPEKAVEEREERTPVDTFLVFIESFLVSNSTEVWIDIEITTNVIVDVQKS